MGTSIPNTLDTMIQVTDQDGDTITYALDPTSVRICLIVFYHVNYLPGDKLHSILIPHTAILLN